ncbi:MAG TPA: hypothetical protein VKV73_20090 [Chloroflexota bacterium]|nr:hypothetical protein [Chloroflexota bacterium]
MIACTPEAIPSHLRERWLSSGKAVFAATAEVRELDDGYACRLPSDADTFGKLAEYVSLDRLCCAFVHWTIDVEPDGGPLWLSMRGGKDVIRQILETTTLLSESVAIAAGLSVSARDDGVLNQQLKE